MPTLHTLRLIGGIIPFTLTLSPYPGSRYSQKHMTIKYCLSPLLTNPDSNVLGNFTVSPLCSLVNFRSTNLHVTVIRGSNKTLARTLNDIKRTLQEILKTDLESRRQRSGQRPRLATLASLVSCSQTRPNWTETPSERSQSSPRPPGTQRETQTASWSCPLPSTSGSECQCTGSPQDPSATWR